MGTYISVGNAGFQRARNSEYVDKSGLIAQAPSFEQHLNKYPVTFLDLSDFVTGFKFFKGWIMGVGSTDHFLR